MKLKGAPEDFRVEELTEVRTGRGPHALYRLTKSGIGTPEAVQAILRAWNLPRSSLSYGGLKDRHALTSQHVSIHTGPRREIQERSFCLAYLGQISRPFVASDICANRFDIQVREVDASHRLHLDSRIAQSQRSGLVNYFDDQRFGSIGVSGELIGAAWCRGNYERALYLALAEPNTHDRPRERDQKKIMRESWGDWNQCKARLDRSHRRSVVTYLVDHPVDYKRALALVRQDLRGIFAAAFQSWVWNRWVSELMVDRLGEAHIDRIATKSGALAVPALLDAQKQQIWQEFAAAALPLPSARIHAWPEGTLPVLERVLETLSMSVREMRFKYPRDTFFSKGLRTVRLTPEGLVWKWEPNPNKPQKNDWIVGFTLPRGCYATMAIRQWVGGLASAEGLDPDWEEEDEPSSSGGDADV
jgi:tRNA pseudouridine13 synthase